MLISNFHLFPLRISANVFLLLERAMATHSSTLAWRVPWMEEPGRLQSMGSLGVGHDWVISLSLFTSMHWRRKRQPTPVFLSGESQGGGSWWAAVYGVAQSWTQLKRLSSSSSMAVVHLQWTCEWCRYGEGQGQSCTRGPVRSWPSGDRISVKRNANNPTVSLPMWFLLSWEIISGNNTVSSLRTNCWNESRLRKQKGLES